MRTRKVCFDKTDSQLKYFLAKIPKCSSVKNFEGTSKTVGEDSYDQPAGFWTQKANSKNDDSNTKKSVEVAAIFYQTLWDNMKAVRDSRIRKKNYDINNSKVMFNSEQALKSFIVAVNSSVECGNGKNEKLVEEIRRRFMDCVKIMRKSALFDKDKYPKLTLGSKDERKKWYLAYFQFSFFFNDLSSIPFTKECGS